MVKKPKQTVENVKLKSNGGTKKGKRKKKQAKVKPPVMDKVKIKSEFDGLVIKKEPLDEVSMNIKVEEGVAVETKPEAGLVSKTAVKNKTKRKANTSKKSEASGLPSTGVVYVGHLPHGFYEDELESYFTQFGPVSGVYVPRSRVTGRPRGYGFIQFSHPEVAKIAAQTMHNYLMFDKLLKTQLVPPEKQKPYMFMHKFKNLKAGNQMNAAIARRNRKVKDSDLQGYVKKAKEKLLAAKRKLKSLGCDYSILVKDLDGSVSPSKVSKLCSKCDEVLTSSSNDGVTGKKTDAAKVTKTSKTKKTKNAKKTVPVSGMPPQSSQEKKVGKNKRKKGNTNSTQPSVDPSNSSIPLKTSDSKKVTNANPVSGKQLSASTIKKSKKENKQTPTAVKLHTPTETKRKRKRTKRNKDSGKPEIP